MSKTYRLGVAGLVHDHVWSELKCWMETGRVEVVAAADPCDRIEIGELQQGVGGGLHPDHPCSVGDRRGNPLGGL